MPRASKETSKNEKEYNVVGSWYTKDNKLDKYSQKIYEEY